MGATLTGVKLFSVRGYAAVENVVIPLGNGATLPVVRMEKKARGGAQSSLAKA
jgi:hypothetical protein